MGVSHDSSSVVRARRIARRRRAGVVDRAAPSRRPPNRPTSYLVYTGTLDADGVASVVALGVDRRELQHGTGRRQPGRVRRSR